VSEDIGHCPITIRIPFCRDRRPRRSVAQLVCCRCKQGGGNRPCCLWTGMGLEMADRRGRRSLRRTRNGHPQGASLQRTVKENTQTVGEDMILPKAAETIPSINIKKSKILVRAEKAIRNTRGIRYSLLHLSIQTEIPEGSLKWKKDAERKRPSNGVSALFSPKEQIRSCNKAAMK